MSPLARPGSRRALARPTPGAGPRPNITTTTSPPPPQRPASDAPDRTGTPGEPVLYTAEQAAGLLQVRPSWLRRKAAARVIPCHYLGKHLRFSRADITAIAQASAQPPRQPHYPSPAP